MLKPLPGLSLRHKKEHQFLDALLSGRQDSLPAGRQGTCENLRMKNYYTTFIHKKSPGYRQG
jgi:hypothetical protein